MTSYELSTPSEGWLQKKKAHLIGLLIHGHGQRGNPCCCRRKQTLRACKSWIGVARFHEAARNEQGELGHLGEKALHVPQVESGHGVHPAQPSCGRGSGCNIYDRSIDFSVKDPLDSAKDDDINFIA